MTLLVLLVTCTIVCIWMASIFWRFCYMAEKDIEMNFFNCIFSLLPIINTILAIYLTDFKEIKKLFIKKN